MGVEVDRDSTGPHVLRLMLVEISTGKAVYWLLSTVGRTEALPLPSPSFWDEVEELNFILVNVNFVIELI